MPPVRRPHVARSTSDTLFAMEQRTSATKKSPKVTVRVGETHRANVLDMNRRVCGCAPHRAGISSTTSAET
eukprot:31235-Pelagococcus_subviridis.AAC.15